MEEEAVRAANCVIAIKDKVEHFCSESIKEQEAFYKHFYHKETAVCTAT